MERGVPPPICLSILLCELVIEDVQTRNKSFINCFNRIVGRELPIVMDHFCIAVALTEGRGSQEARLEIRTPEDEKLLDVVGPLDFREVNAVAEFVFQFRQLRFYRAGMHQINYWIDTHLVGSRRFDVTLVREGEGKTKNG